MRESLESQLSRYRSELMSLGEYLEFRTFLIGTRVPAGFDEEEAERVRRSFNVRLGQHLEQVWPSRSVDFRQAEVRFLIDLASDRIDLQIAPVCIAGFYRKLVRGIPQSKWPCRRCLGEGCERCGGTGQQYTETVEGFLAAPVLERTGGGGSKIHALGREDIDARMLGDGRPFILEILSPRRRAVPLREMEREIVRRSAGRVEARRMTIASPAWIPRLKEARADKTYRAVVEVEGRLPGDFDTVAGELAGSEIRQETPSRVRHRRPNRLRERRIRTLVARATGDSSLELTIRAEAGLYIKELISGDEGRSVPSLSGLLGVPSRCVELDVLEVHWDLDRLGCCRRI